MKLQPRLHLPLLPPLLLVLVLALVPRVAVRELAPPRSLFLVLLLLPTDHIPPEATTVHAVTTRTTWIIVAVVWLSMPAWVQPPTAVQPPKSRERRKRGFEPWRTEVAA